MSAANEGSDRPSPDGRTLTTTGTPYRHRQRSPIHGLPAARLAYGDDGKADAGQQKKGARTSYRDIRAPEGRRLPTLPTGGSVPSAMAGLTALFGMDRGGSPPQWPPSITLGENQQDSDADQLTTYPLFTTPNATTLLLSSYRLITSSAASLSRIFPRREVFRGISTGRLWHHCLYTSRLSTS